MALRPIKVIIEGIDRLSKQLEAPMSKLDKMAKDVGKVGKAMTIGLSLPIMAAGGAAVKMSTDLNAAMANVATIIPHNTERILELKKNVQDMSIVMGKSTGDIADGLYQVVSSFGDSAETAKILELNVKAAAAGLATTSDAINFTSAVTKAYGDTSAAAMQKVADLGFQTVNLGITTFPELAASIGSVTPLAKVMGMSLEELFGVMATASGVTGNTAEVTTQLSSILSALIKPTSTMTSLFEHLGYANGQAMMKELGFVKTLQTIVNMADKAGVSLGDLLGRKEGMTLAFALTGAQADDLNKKLDAMKNVAGTLDTAFNEQTQGINKTGFAMQQATARLTVLAQKFGDRLAPAILKVLDAATPFLDWITNLKPEAMTTILVIAGIVASIGPLMLAFTGATALVVNFTAALKHVPLVAKIAGFAIKGLGAALKFLFLNPVGLAILGIAAWGYAIYQLIKNWDDLMDAFSSKFMFLQTLNFFFADIAKSIGDILAYIPGLGKLADFFHLAGKGFEIKAAELAAEKFGSDKPSPAMAAGKIGSSVTTNKSEVKVSFANMPKGSKVESLYGDVDLETDTGALLAGSF